MSKIVGLILTTVLLGLAAGGAVANAEHKGPVVAITHGVIVGDVTSSSALLWARADREATLNVAVSGGPHGRIAHVEARAADDFTARVPLEHLRPGTTYR
jgi:alkaline phosphatase D